MKPAVTNAIAQSPYRLPCISVGPLQVGVGCALIEDHAQVPDVRHLHESIWPVRSGALFGTNLSSAAVTTRIGQRGPGIASTLFR
jgi:hypothetical protein